MIDLSWQFGGVGFAWQGKTPVLMLIADASPSGCLSVLVLSWERVLCSE
jgi:hypothetical protein